MSNSVIYRRLDLGSGMRQYHGLRVRPTHMAEGIKAWNKEVLCSYLPQCGSVIIKGEQ